MMPHSCGSVPGNDHLGSVYLKMLDTFEVITVLSDPVSAWFPFAHSLMISCAADTEVLLSSAPGGAMTNVTATALIPAAAET